MAKIYYYKLSTDNGGAPCVTPSLLSLAICKPMIRSTASVGDILIGFAANGLQDDNRLIYIARVSQKLVDGNYYRMGKYQKRGDCIYVWRKGRLVFKNRALYHGTPRDLLRDVGAPPRHPRANTLLSHEFCYFGASGTDAYKKAFPEVGKAFRMLARGHRVNHRPQMHAQLETLVSRVCTLDGPCVKGQPHNPVPGRARIGGCGCGPKRKGC